MMDAEHRQLRCTVMTVIYYITVMSGVFIQR
jgi:hypothetical protein